MGPKILWVLLPLAVYAALLALAWRGKAPSRLALNVHSSLLLMAYLLTTAGLGLFWVANQQLPVFDWHYLFGYATLLLVSLHLFFNLPVALRWLRQPSAPPARAGPARTGRWRGGLLLMGAVAALAVAFALGTHWAGRQSSPVPEHAIAADASGVATVLRYHEASSTSRRGILGRAPAVDWGEQAAPFKTYPAAQHIALPSAAPGGAPAPSLGDALRGAAIPRAELDLRALGQLLHLTAGVTARRGGLALRAAPSSGALFPGELYLAVRRVAGLQPGLYHFDPDQHRLARLGALPPAFAAADADLLMVVAAVFQRTGYKYRDRAYRYVAADLGHLLENARLAGRHVGARTALLERFDETALASAFGLDGVQEAVIAAATFSAGAGASAGEPPGTVVAKPQASKPLSDFGVTGAVHSATSLSAPPPAREMLQAKPQSADGAAIVALPAGEPAKMDLASTILQRRSQRRFTAEPVQLKQLASMLADMSQAPLLSPAIHADLVINRVEGLQPGVYRYLPARHALQPVQPGDFAAQARNTALDQDVIGDAAVVLILSADSEQALRYGARGYRMAFLEAGLMGERWLLGAVARGLGACPVGAFYDDEAAQLVKAPAGRWVLHFAALGKVAN